MQQHWKSAAAARLLPLKLLKPDISTAYNLLCQFSSIIPIFTGLFGTKLLKLRVCPVCPAELSFPEEACL